MSHAHDSTRFRGLLYVAKSQQGCRLIKQVSSHQVLMHDANLRMIWFLRLCYLFPNLKTSPKTSHFQQPQPFSTRGRNLCRGITRVPGHQNHSKQGERKRQGWDPTLGSSKNQAVKLMSMIRKNRHVHRQALQTRQILKFSPNSWACFRNISLWGPSGD